MTAFEPRLSLFESLLGIDGVEVGEVYSGLLDVVADVVADVVDVVDVVG